MTVGCAISLPLNFVAGAAHLLQMHNGGASYHETKHGRHIIDMALCALLSTYSANCLLSQQGLQVDVIFMDADIVFTEDPIPLLQDPLKSGLADLSVSLDTRKTLRNSTDPYEGQHAVPFACGGFFYARSNARTIRYFRDMRNLLEEPRWFATDQTAAYALLNQAGRVSLVGEVPAALQLRPGINVDKQIARRLIAPQGGRVLPPVERSAGKETVLSVRILDNERWINGAAMTASPWHNSTVTMMHFNVPPEFMPKLSYIQKVHAWYLDDKGHCMK